MGQFINSRDTLVTEAIDGFLRGQDGQVSRLDGFPHIKVVVRADWKLDQVAIISGGGSGHGSSPRQGCSARPTRRGRSGGGLRSGGPGHDRGFVVHR